jgi:hypothetical protein
MSPRRAAPVLPRAPLHRLPPPSAAAARRRDVVPLCFGMLP